MSNITIARKTYFSAAVDSDKSQYGQGYNFCLEAFITGKKDPVSGLVMNLTDLDKILEELKSNLDHKHLNKDISIFIDNHYSCSALAEHCFQFIDCELNKLKIMDLSLSKVALSQGDDVIAEVLSNSK